MRLIAMLLAALLLLAGCIQNGSTGQEEKAAGPAEKAAAGPVGGAASTGLQKTPDNGTTDNGTNVGTVRPPVLNTKDVMMADYVPPGIAHYDFSNATGADGNLIVYYFHLPGCTACIALQPEIERLRAAYPGVAWVDYDIATQNGSAAYRDFAAQRNLNTSERMVPQVLVNGTVITNKFDINATLENIIKNFPDIG